MHRILRIGVLNEDVIDPNSDEIEKALKQLEALRYDDNAYAILEVPNSGFNFIQALFDGGSITLEFQKTDTGKQYSTIANDTKKIIDVFLKYNEGNTSWKNNLDWKEVEY
ncbi:MAG: hypothetical protein ACJ06V_09265 [Verrucomicrobiota bacterium]